MMEKPCIGFVGLTHLGLNSAVASAERGFNIIAFDQNELRVKSLNSGGLEIVEPGLEEMLSNNKSKLTFTSDPIDLAKADIIYISTDVPTNEHGVSDIASIMDSISYTIKCIKSDAILVVLCQVPPLFTRKINWPKHQLFYQVETLIFGKAVDRALNPERFIVGCDSLGKGIPDSLTNYLSAFNCPILPMSYESAELTKIAINMFLISSVSTTNTLAEICEKIGAKWTEVAPALRLDKRIGPHAYLSPGLGIAGGNLERDINTILELGERFSTKTSVVSSWVENSIYRKKWAFDITKSLLDSEVSRPINIGILGLTYKEDTHSLKNSASIELITSLIHLDEDIQISSFDPSAAEVHFSPKVFSRKTNILQAVDNADYLIIMTPWKEFKSINCEDLIARMRGKTVLDPYKVLDSKALRNNDFTYYTLGE